MQEFKTCSKCGNLCDLQAKFCSKCGNNQFEYNQIQQSYDKQQNIPQQQSFNLNQQGNYASPNNNFDGYNSPINYSDGVPSSKKTGNKGWIIAIISVSVVVVVLLIILFAVLCNNSNQNNSSYNNDSITNNITATENDLDSDSNDSGGLIINNDENNGEYTKGEIIDGWYSNEWANIKFKTTEDFYDMPEKHSNYENTTTDCAFAYVDSLLGNQFVVAFEDLSSHPGITVDEYVDALKSVLESSYSTTGSKLISSKNSSIRIAGEEYKTIEHQITNTNGMKIKILTCARIIGDKAVFISISSQDDSWINSRLNNIETIK